MIRSSLGTILNRIPAILRNRYAGNNNLFWVNAYNDLLTKIETTGIGPGLTARIPVPWDMVQGSLAKPAGVSRIIRAWHAKPMAGSASYADWCNSWDPVVIESDGRGIRIPGSGPSGIYPTTSTPIVQGAIGTPYAFSERTMLPTTVLANSGQPIQVGHAYFDYGTRSPMPNGPYTPFALFNPGGPPTASWVIDYVRGTDVALPMESGEYDLPVAAGDNIIIMDDYLVIEGIRRFADIVPAVDPFTVKTSFDPNFDDFVATWLRFRGEFQTDQDSKQANQWGAAWDASWKEFVAHFAHANPNMRQRDKLRPTIQMSAWRR